MDNPNSINRNSNAWYEKTWLVILLCIVFFPVGIFALWKNSSISKAWKIIGTVLIGLLIIVAANDNDKSTNSSVSERKDNTTPFATETTKSPGIGEILKTRYFEIIANKVSISP